MYMYIQVSEVLHIFVEKACTLGIIEAIRFGKNMVISHLFFVDDTIFFLNSNEHSIKGIKMVLIIFQIITGLKVNFNKSILFPSKEYARSTTSRQALSVVRC